MVTKYTPKRQKSRAGMIRAFKKRAASRSGRVVTYKVGEEKPDLPSPLKSQVRRQDRWLR